MYDSRESECFSPANPDRGTLGKRMQDRKSDPCVSGSSVRQWPCAAELSHVPLRTPWMWHGSVIVRNAGSKTSVKEGEGEVRDASRTIPCALQLVSYARHARRVRAAPAASPCRARVARPRRARHKSVPVAARPCRTCPTLATGPLVPRTSETRPPRQSRSKNPKGSQ